MPSSTVASEAVPVQPAAAHVLSQRGKRGAAVAGALVVALCFARFGLSGHAVVGSIFAATSIPLSYVGARLAVRTQAVHLERAYGVGLALLGTALLIAGL